MMICHHAIVAERPPRRGRGFTLMEAALVTVIIGVGVVAMMELLAAGTVVNRDGAESTTAMNLARNVREMSLGLAFADPTDPTHWGLESGETLATCDDIDDLDGATFTPPIDARRMVLSDMQGWAQAITVQSVDPNRLSFVTVRGTTPANRVTVTVTHFGKPIYSMSWLAMDADPN